MQGVHCPTLIHPSVLLGDEERNNIGDGSIICAGVILTTNITFGSFVIINLSCTIGHDVKIGSYSSIMPQCSLSGFIELGELVYIGAGGRILPGLKIGTGATVGAGAVVTKNVLEEKTVMGVPAIGRQS
jgi:sugar O-acyltransferase (sialic acid O-acetyltransferase NeuD family)